MLRRSPKAVARRPRRSVRAGRGEAAGGVGAPGGVEEPGGVGALGGVGAPGPPFSSEGSDGEMRRAGGRHVAARGEAP